MASSDQASIENRYATAVRALFAPPPSAQDRGAGAPTFDAMESDAKNVLALSDELLTSQQTNLGAPDPQDRIQATLRLLAKAAIEIEISAYLKQAGDDEKDGAPPPAATLANRSAQTSLQIEDLLRALTGSRAAATINRSIARPKDLPDARSKLTENFNDVCDRIAERAGKSGKKAFEGLMGVGLSELGQAALSLANGAAEWLGAGDVVGRFYNLCRDFLKKAYDSILALIGDEVARKLGEKIEEWVSDAREAHLFADWLANAYGLKGIKQAEGQAIAASSREDLGKFVSASVRLDELEGAHGSEMDLTDKITAAFGYMRLVPWLATPHGLLFRAGAYVLLIGWAVLDGADYLEAERLRLLKRVDGVRATVAQQIG